VSRVFLLVTAAAGVLALSWALMTVLARRLPPGSARDLASVKLAIAFAGLWVLSPIDLIPEFLPIIGPLDDVIVVALAFRYAGRQVPRAVLFEAWPADERILSRLLGVER